RQVEGNPLRLVAGQRTVVLVVELAVVGDQANGTAALADGLNADVLLAGSQRRRTERAIQPVGERVRVSAGWQDRFYESISGGALETQYKVSAAARAL